MTQYNVTVEFDSTLDDLSDDQIDALLESMPDLHAALGRSAMGRAELTITLDDNPPYSADTVWTAPLAAHWTMMFVNLLKQDERFSGTLFAGSDIVSIHTLPTTDFDVINKLDTLPGLFPDSQ